MEYFNIKLDLHALRIRRSLVKLSGLVKSMTEMVTGCLRTTRVAIFAFLTTFWVCKHFVSCVRI